MAIIDLQKRVAETGRIRIGQQVPSSSGGRRPAKLDTFRLTSADKEKIAQAAELYGGEPKEWTSPAGKQWEVITERDVLEVIVPPAALSFSQNYELWSAGGCLRRCDGQEEQISGGPCLCDPAARECDIHSRLSVLLRDLPGLGVWRLDTQGYYAAVELQGAVELIGMAAGTRLLPARLRLDQRSVKRPGANGKPETRRFAVPVLDIAITPALLLSGGQGETLPMLEAKAPLTPVPPADESGPTIAEQSEPPGEKPRRRGSGPELPRSGRRRGAAEATPEETPSPEALIESAAAATGGEVVDVPAAAEQKVSCTHPADRRVTTPAGAVVCGVERCGELLQEAPESDAPVVNETAPPADEPKKAAPRSRSRAKAEASADAEPTGEAADPDYWMKRLHAVAGERDIDHDGLRLIAAAVKKVPADELASFSMTELGDSTCEGLDKLIRSFPESLDVDGATEWVAKVAVARSLTGEDGDADWKAIDALATAALPVALDDAGIAHWIAFGLRLHAGEYDPKE